MVSSELTASVLALPEEDRLELARTLFESVFTDEDVDKLIEEGIERMEEVTAGKVRMLSEEEYRAQAE